MRILIVDDERAFAEVIADLLRDEGHVVDVAHSGCQALEAYADGTMPPDVLVCDVMLPDLRGDKLVEALRESHPRHPLPALLLSASRSPAVTHDRVAFLAKPVDFDDLVSTVARLVDMATATDGTAA